MNAINRVVSAIFDAVLTPFEAFGNVVALILISGVFGILALLLFKRISWQKGIKATKDKIKGHMIAIRIYQDDLWIVLTSVIKVVLRNFQYLGLNFGPILPLFAPFVLIAAQLVVRYGFDPVPIIEPSKVATMLPGRGTMLEVFMKPGRANEVSKLEVRLPAHLLALSPLARNERDGIAVMEFVAIGPGTADLQFLVDGISVGTKSVTAGSPAPRVLQPERVSGFWSAWLWPAEPTFPADSPIGEVRFPYPAKDLGWLPGGPGGVLITFFIASIVFGIAILKPFNIQI